jgi:hypothetical protein
MALPGESALPLNRTIMEDRRRRFQVSLVDMAMSFRPRRRYDARLLMIEGFEIKKEEVRAGIHPHNRVR